MIWIVDVFNKKLLFIWALFLILFSSPLFANIDHINWWNMGSKYQNNPAMGWHIVTFLVFVGGIFYLVRKPLIIYLEARTKNIQKAILEAKHAKDEANSRIKTYENRLKSLDKEMASLRVEFLEIGKNEKKRLTHEADIVKKQIETEAISVISAETAQAKIVLKAQAAQLSIVLARKELETGNVQVDNLALNDEFLSDISQEERA